MINVSSQNKAMRRLEACEKHQEKATAETSHGRMENTHDIGAKQENQNYSI